MVKRTRCGDTLDLLYWQPPKVAAGFEDEARVRAHSLRHRIARALSEMLKDSGQSRAEIAEAMAEFLDEDFGEATLNAYASPAREGHNITLERAIALLAVTRDPRLLGDLVAPYGFAVIPNKYLAAIEDAMCDDVLESITQRRKQARRTWRGSGS
jgi:hypothetical protein